MSALLAVPTLVMVEACIVQRNAMRAVCLFHVYLLLVAVAFRIRKTSASVRPLSPRRTRRRTELAAFAGMFAFGVVTYLFCRYLSKPQEYLGVNLTVLRTTLDDFGVRGQKSMLLFAVYFALANSFLEETVWRGTFRRLTKKSYSSSDALVSAAYAAYHNAIIVNLMPPWFNLLVAFPFLAFFGLLLTKVADKKGLWTAIALHAGLDAATAFWVLDIRFGYLDPLYFVSS